MGYQIVPSKEHEYTVTEVPQKPHYTGAPLHPLAAIVVIVLDLLWTPEEAGAAISIIGLTAEPFLILSVAFVAFAAVLAIQRFIARDSWGISTAKALAMAVVAGVPFSVMGTPVGGVLLAWAGASFLGEKLGRLLNAPKE